MTHFKPRTPFTAAAAMALVLLATAPAPGQSGRAGVWDARSGDSGSSSNSNYTRQNTNPNSRAGYGLPGTQPAQGRQKSADYEDAFNSGGIRRRYLLHIPANHDPNRPVPLVLAFHGLQMTGDLMRGASLFDLTSNQYGFIVAYPDAVNRRWNDGHMKEGVDDVAFVSDLINHISRRFKIDSHKVYAAGISNGGFFAERLACELSNQIAAVAVVGATATTTMSSTCRCRRAVPIVFFIGTDDPLFPHRKEEHKELDKLGDALGLSDLGVTSVSATVAKAGGYMTGDEAAEFWARQNGCSLSPRVEQMPDRSNDGCKVTKETFSGSNEVVLYTIEGGGHTWPGGGTVVAKDMLGRTTMDISASDSIWAFFAFHPMH